MSDFFDSVLVKKTVDVRGKKVVVKEMGFGEYQKIAEASKDDENFAIRALIETATDEKGKPIFKEGDEEKIKNLPASVVTTLTQALMEVNGLGEEKN